MGETLDRRSFLGGSVSALAAALLPVDTFAAVVDKNQPGADPAVALDQFASAYMKTMHAPGMTVGLLSSDQPSTRSYGYSNLEARVTVDVTQPFWIGSICKSFVGIVAVQLRDEGKLDLHEPVREIMPDLPFTENHGQITAHHLLTHTSGLPNWLQLIANDPTQRATQAYAPGERFAYSNLGYDTLGLLIAQLDRRSWPTSVTARILEPLGMTHTSAMIDAAVQAQMPIGYHFQYRDRPCTVGDPLVAVGYVSMSNAAGSIAAPAEDMCKYMRMLIERGRGPHKRLVSEEGFELFSRPYIKAPVLSPNAGYGYGVGVETIDGRTMLRHTGGATAFASSILVDLDGAVGAFASINAMQGYRPNPVTKYSVDLLYASKSAPAGRTPSAVATPKSPKILEIEIPEIKDPLSIEHSEFYAGRYKTASGEVLTVAADNDGLTIATPRGTSALRPLGGDMFSAADDSAMSISGQAQVPSAFALVFERAPQQVHAPGAVTGLHYGSRWYAGERTGVIAAPASETAGRYIGSYTNDSPWLDLVRVVAGNGKLWLDGTAEMRPIKEDRFSVEGGEGILQVDFASFLQGRAQLLLMGGDAFRRVALPSGD